MHKSFWDTRWNEGRIAFHESEPHQHLVGAFEQLSLSPGAHVFVPLCGKTVDIDWLLSRGQKVSGIEWNRDAVLEVFDRLEITPKARNLGALEELKDGDLTLWVGDFFELQSEQLGAVDAIYDRAALVALPTDTRKNYSRHLSQLCGGAPQLLISYDYDQSQTDGPPFSVPESEIRRLYGSRFHITNAASAAINGPLAARCEGQEQGWIIKAV